MRASILLIAATLTLAVSPAHAAPRKNFPANVGAGRVAWFDIATTDVAKSKDFYAKLFNWRYAAVIGTDQAVTIVSTGKAIGTIRKADGALSNFNGVVYVQVPDVQASCKKAAELGANVVPGFPFNLPDSTGAIGLAGDPGGAPFGMYSKKLLPPAK